MKAHPDRLAATLAQRDALPSTAWQGPFATPGPGSDDARVDLKLAAHRAARILAARGTPAARARLAGLDTPDLLAGTVQDGTARGLLVALEEAISLCEAPPPSGDTTPADVLEGRALRRKRDILIASASARIRFSRKGGLLLVDRGRGVHVLDCMRFEDRTDRGTLDGFAPLEEERPRLFSPGFLQPVRLEESRGAAALWLRGRLGRRPDGYPCELGILAAADRDGVELRIRIENRRPDHRLRVRFAGLPDDYPIAHAGTPAWESIVHRGGRFRAATLVRACGRLDVGGASIAVPAAQCLGVIEHRMTLGAPELPPAC